MALIDRNELILSGCRQFIAVTNHQHVVSVSV